MKGEQEFLQFAASVLGVSSDSLSFETMYGSIPEWDSLAHLRLVMEGHARYGVEIPFQDVVSVRSLWEFYRRFHGLSPKKVVAVDLDNTLWQGVVGEDGPDAIRPNIPFLTTLKALKDRGVLLVALSKNNEEDGLAGLECLECLVKNDFVAWRINWNEKADNLIDVAKELNLGTDAFVFVDDSPSERLRMKTLLPEVTVAAFPPNLVAYFPEGEVTDEDRRKTDEYRAEARRKKFAEELSANEKNAGRFSPQFFAAALGVWVKVRVMEEADVARVAQLSQKANQFNACTSRFSEQDIRRLSKEGQIITCHAGDTFGDQGLVAFAVIRSDGAYEASLAEWVMSCRVTGRGIEERFEEELERILTKQGVREVTVTWKASGKNAPVRDLFDRLGFERITETEKERRYFKHL